MQSLRNSGSGQEIRKLDMSRKVKIAAVAIEDDEVLMTVATGHAFEEVYKNTGLRLARFAYESILPQPIRIRREGGQYEHLRQGRDFASSLLERMISDFLDRLGDKPDIIGISTFGTVNTKTGEFHHRPSRGQNKLGYIRLNLQDLLARHGIPVVADNDATAAAFGEYLFGVGQAHQLAAHHAFAYVWAGRGLNAGIVIDGMPWQGKLHPEMGHLPARRYMTGLHEKGRDPHPGNCGSHDDCLTGLAGRRAFMERAAMKGWTERKSLDAMAYYIAQLCAALTLTVVPVSIALGGLSFRGEHAETLLERVRHYHSELFVADFPGYDDISTAQEVLIRSELGDQASLLGAMEIARRHLFPTHQLYSGDMSHVRG